MDVQKSNEVSVPHEEKPIESVAPAVSQKEQKMDVDTADQIDENDDEEPPKESVPSTQPIDETITIDGDSLNASPEISNEATPVDVTPSVSVAADTTTAIVIEEDDDDEDDEPASQKIVIVDSEKSENEVIEIKEVSPVRGESPQNVPSQSTVEEPVTVVELIDDESTDANDTAADVAPVVDITPIENDVAKIPETNNTDHAKEIVQNVVESTNNDTIIENVDAALKTPSKLIVWIYL